MSLNGMINGLCFDNNGYIYVTDLNQCAIFFKQISSVEQSPLIENIIAKEYDGKPFHSSECCHVGFHRYRYY